MDRVTEIYTKKDMSRFARAHEDGPINWETFPGPFGSITVVEHLPDEDEPTS